MARIGIDYLCTGTYTSLDSYDSSKWNLGSLFKQYTDNYTFIGPIKISQTYPATDNPSFTAQNIDAFQWSSDIDWVFGASVTTRTFYVSFWEYNRSIPSYTYRNYLIIDSPSSTGNHTLRGFKALYYTYTGTATITLKGGTGRRVNASGFTDRRIAAGSRIGFLTTDPTQVTTWYTIDTINSNTQLDTIEVISILDPETSVDITFTQDHSYVIEEMRFVFGVTNTTAANGGIILAKGIKYTDFSPSTVTISGATSSTDNLRNSYRLIDAATLTNTFISGLGIDGNRQINSEGRTHSCYTIDATSSRSYMYNLRASDSISTGVMTLTQSNTQATAAQTITGIIQSHNGQIATTRHGLGTSQKSLYFISSTRLFRSPVTEITNSRTNWYKDIRPEIPSGGTNTTAATSLVNYLDYDEISDRFLVYTSGASAIRSYVTKFPNSGNKLDNIFLFFSGTTDGPSATSSYVALPFNNGSGQIHAKTVNGITHQYRWTGSSTACLYAIPISAHWEFANETNQYVVSPVVITPNNKNLIRMVINNISSLGSGPYVTPINDIRSYYRTSGFSDNSGLWYSLGKDGDLSAIGDCKKIQFRFEFQMLGNCWGIPGRLLGFTLIYDDLVIQSNHQPSVLFSTSKSFAWRFSATYSSTLPNLRVRLYDATTSDLLVDDNTSSPKGIFEKTTNGATWSSWDNLDKTNETTYIRYTPSSLMDGAKIRATLTTL
jgi:hypothetical protein